MKMHRCFCRLIPRGVQLRVFNASVEEESGGASSSSLAALFPRKEINRNNFYDCEQFLKQKRVLFGSHKWLELG